MCYYKILHMLDWSQPQDIQEKGKEEARLIVDLAVLIQPFSEQYNKNIWGNCAEVLVEKKDKELEPYLSKLLEWLRDLNWPGALTVYNRLKRFTEKDALQRAIYYSIASAKEENDGVWEETLHQLAREHWCQGDGSLDNPYVGYQGDVCQGDGSVDTNCGRRNVTGEPFS